MLDIFNFIDSDRDSALIGVLNFSKVQQPHLSRYYAGKKHKSLKLSEHKIANLLDSLNCQC